MTRFSMQIQQFQGSSHQQLEKSNGAHHCLCCVSNIKLKTQHSECSDHFQLYSFCFVFFFFSPMFSFLLLIYGEECSLIVCLHISWASYTSFKECLQYCSNILKRRNACFTFGYTFYFGKIKHCS